VIGKPIQEATDTLARTRLTILTLSVTTDRVKPGTVLAQRPAGGTPVTRAKVESLWVASAPRMASRIGQRPATVGATDVGPPPARAPDDVARPPKDVAVPKDLGLRTMVPGVVVQARTKVPDLFRLTPQQVPAALERYQLRQGETTRDYSDDVPSGQVFRQHPQAGAEAITWSTVDIWYSTGPHPPAAEVTVPSVVGLSLREAVDSLRRVGLRPDISTGSWPPERAEASWTRRRMPVSVCIATSQWTSPWLLPRRGYGYRRWLDSRGPPPKTA
jgi:hypothetical protein